MKIKLITDDPTVNLVLDTLEKKKQAIVFANTKRSAEKCAEDIADQIKNTNELFMELSEKSLHALSSPTKQCRRLANCLKKGIAFHHAGLTHKQRELVEDNFRAGKLKVICSTPTLAYGLDLPAYRVVLKDLRRFTHRGMQYIPVLEYLQMAGRAGRPKFDKSGEAVAVCNSEDNQKKITEKYVYGLPEDIESKLAVEPVLRTYLLSLIATNFVNTKKEILKFFEGTFWAYQFEDMHRLELIIEKILNMLIDWEFVIEKSSNLDEAESFKDFKSADDTSEGVYEATLIGKRVAELYIDPLTAHDFVIGLKRSKDTLLKSFSFLHLVASTLEMRPLLKVRTKEYEDIQSALLKYEGCLLKLEPDIYESEFDDYLNGVKTAMMLQEWIDEKDEEYLLERYTVRPGELRVKIGNADWLLYATEEIARLLKLQKVISEIKKTRFRLKHGAKEELITLLKIKNIGRVRARKMFGNGIKTIGDVKKADVMKLIQLIGRNTTIKVKEEVGEKIDLAIKPGKRKGQLSLSKFTK
jgi:helicase